MRPLRRRASRSGPSAAARLTSVATTIALVRCFSPQHPALTVSEGARLVGADKGTVSRILARLAGSGLLERASDGRSYHVGLGMLQLGELYLRANPIAVRACPMLAVIARGTGCTVQLVLRDGAQCVVVATASGPGAPQPPVGAEIRLPLHASAAGKAFLAWMPEDDLRRLLAGGRLISYTGRTLSSLDSLHGALREIRRRGYAEAEEEYFLGQHAVAVPVPGRAGAASAALVGVSSRSLDLVGGDAVLLTRLQRAAERLGRILGEPPEAGVTPRRRISMSGVAR